MNPYTEFNKGLEWRRELAKTATYKALDIPESDGVEVVVNRNISRGMGWRELLVVGGIVLGGLFAMRPDAPDPTPVPAANVPDTEYEVRFYDADGNPIDIEQR